MSVMGSLRRRKDDAFENPDRTAPDGRGKVKFLEKDRESNEMLEYCGIVPAEGGFPDCLNAKEISRILKELL